MSRRDSIHARKTGQKGPAAAGLSGKERGAIEAFVVHIQGRVKDIEPVCAKLVRKARLSLGEPEAPQDPMRVLH